MSSQFTGISIFASSSPVSRSHPRVSGRGLGRARLLLLLLLWPSVGAGVLLEVVGHLPVVGVLAVVVVAEPRLLRRQHLVLRAPRRPLALAVHLSVDRLAGQNLGAEREDLR